MDVCGCVRVESEHMYINTGVLMYMCSDICVDVDECLECGCTSVHVDVCG